MYISFMECSIHKKFLFSLQYFCFQNLSLKLHYRIFTAHLPNATRAVYLSFVDTLAQFFQSQEGGVVVLSMGVDPADDRCIQILAKVGVW